MKRIIGLFLLAIASLPAVCLAQVNSGSNGSDGALDYSSLTNLGYSTNIVINMADHLTGIYQYTYVNIPNNVTVSFIPNANNTPVTWLVQSNVIVNGEVDVSGQTASSYPQTVGPGGLGGPGGYKGGDGGIAADSGQGPGGGLAGAVGQPASSAYGNQYLIPLIGGSGGGGCTNTQYFGGGGGGGGAILIAASQSIQLGYINASGGGGGWDYVYYGGSTFGGGGSGGEVRLVATTITGNGSINTSGGGGAGGLTAGSGRVRFDSYENDFIGGISGAFTKGSQFVVIPAAGQLPQLTVTSVGGVSVPPSPTGVLTTPDAVLSAQQNNPIPVVVSCANLPLNSLITVSVTPANGTPASATGYNSTGTLASSTATISIIIPRGGGLIYATATTSN